jgi:hypothetical protein
VTFQLLSLVQMGRTVNFGGEGFVIERALGEFRFFFFLAEHPAFRKQKSEKVAQIRRDRTESYSMITGVSRQSRLLRGVISTSILFNFGKRKGFVLCFQVQMWTITTMRRSDLPSSPQTQSIVSRTSDQSLVYPSSRNLPGSCAGASSETVHPNSSIVKFSW